MGVAPTDHPADQALRLHKPGLVPGFVRRSVRLVDLKAATDQFRAVASERPCTLLPSAMSTGGLRIT
jgi:hypothetical protein